MFVCFLPFPVWMYPVWIVLKIVFAIPRLHRSLPTQSVTEDPTNNSYLHVFFVERSTPDPEPSPPSPRCAERKPEPTEDGEPVPGAINEPAQYRATEWRIAPDAEPSPSEQVREPATTPATREQAVDGESTEWSTAAEGELIVHLGLLDVEGDLIDWETDLGDRLAPSPLSFVPAGPVHPSFVSCPHVQPRVGSCFPVQPWERLSPQVQPGVGFDPGGQAWEPGGSRMPTNAPPPLSSGSPSAHLQPTIYKVRAPRFCHPPSSPWLENPSPPPPASEARTPPRTVDPAAPISLASTVTCRSTRLPCPSGSALVGQI